LQFSSMTLIFFIYGLSFFTMGVVITFELGRCSDPRQRLALRYLAAFGILHGMHEWLEMFNGLGAFTYLPADSVYWGSLHIFILAISFLPLGIFGISLLASHPRYRGLRLLVPLGLAVLWAFGGLVLRGYFPMNAEFFNVLDVWTRYSLAIPSALLACTGLIFQQREFRRAGMAQFGQDSLWAAIAFAWYGLVGQLFTEPSRLPPSTVLNSSLFLQLFGFPVQILRAVTAAVAALFVIRFLRSFEVETQRKIDELQKGRLLEAQRRETLRGELFRRVVAAQESERQRIARELHDETGQSLTALGLGLRGVTTQMRTDVEKAAANLRQLERMVGASIDELQHIIGDLRPSHLDDLGLAAALRWYCGELQKRSPLKISIDIQGEPRELSAEVKTAIFRIAQEALSNVIRHSKANQARLLLDFQNTAVLLRIEDDGIGFDASKLSNPARPSWGLLGMEERATLLGGNLKLHSNPGEGTQIESVIPYNQESKDAKHDDNPSAAGG
jgi:signal transduction histidine kinase